MDWNKFDRGIFLVNVLAIIYDPENKKILVGHRENDPYIPAISWTFPGGRPAYDKDLEEYLKSEVKSKTGLEVEIRKMVFAKTYPEKREFLSIYYHCDVVEGQARAGDTFTEVKWISPMDIKDYFTTSVHPVVENYLYDLE